MEKKINLDDIVKDFGIDKHIKPIPKYGIPYLKPCYGVEPCEDSEEENKDYRIKQITNKIQEELSKIKDLEFKDIIFILVPIVNKIRSDAIQKHSIFKNNDEYIGVLEEEFREAKHNFENMSFNLEYIWQKKMANNREGIIEFSYALRHYTNECICEMLQILAVIQKLILNGTYREGVDNETI